MQGAHTPVRAQAQSQNDTPACGPGRWFDHWVLTELLSEGCSPAWKYLASHPRASEGLWALGTKSQHVEGETNSLSERSGPELVEKAGPGREVQGEGSALIKATTFT